MEAYILILQKRSFLVFETQKGRFFYIGEGFLDGLSLTIAALQSKVGNRISPSFSFCNTMGNAPCYSIPGIIP